MFSSNSPSGSIFNGPVVDDAVDGEPFGSDAVLIKSFVQQQLVFVHVFLA